VQFQCASDPWEIWRDGNQAFVIWIAFESRADLIQVSCMMREAQTRQLNVLKITMIFTDLSLRTHRSIIRTMMVFLVS
jgi:hypothetical protein